MRKYITKLQNFYIIIELKPTQTYTYLKLNALRTAHDFNVKYSGKMNPKILSKRPEMNRKTPKYTSKSDYKMALHT